MRYRWRRRSRRRLGGLQVRPDLLVLREVGGARMPPGHARASTRGDRMAEARLPRRARPCPRPSGACLRKKVGHVDDEVLRGRRGGKGRRWGGVDEWQRCRRARRPRGAEGRRNRSCCLRNRQCGDPALQGSWRRPRALITNMAGSGATRMNLAESGSTWRRQGGAQGGKAMLGRAVPSSRRSRHSWQQAGA